MENKRITRKLSAILIIALFSCKSGNHSVAKANHKEVLIYYSKRPCLGNCPVYDFWIFTDGSFLYKEAFKNKRGTTMKGRLSPGTVKDLIAFLGAHLGDPTIFRQIRDRPKTVLRYDEKEFEYYATKISGPLKEVDAKIDALLRRLRIEKPAKKQTL